MNGDQERLHKVESTVALLVERLDQLATKDDVASLKIWFVVTTVALAVAVATVGAAIAS